MFIFTNQIQTAFCYFLAILEETELLATKNPLNIAKELKIGSITNYIN